MMTWMCSPQQFTQNVGEGAPPTPGRSHWPLTPPQVGNFSDRRQHLGNGYCARPVGRKQRIGLQGYGAVFMRRDRGQEPSL